MNESRAAMERVLKSTVIPWLRSGGFKGSLPHFRRRGAKAIDLLTFQFDRYGGGFIVEIAQCPLEGTTTHWGKAIPPEKVTAWDMDWTSRNRIRAEDKLGTDGWFRFDTKPPEQLAGLLLTKLADKDLWQNLDLHN